MTLKIDFPVEVKSTNSPLTNQEQTAIAESVVDRHRDNPIMKARTPDFMYNPPFGMPRNIPTEFLRELAKNPYIYSIVKTLQNEAAAMPWDIVPREGYEVTEEDEKTRLKIKNFFENPNSDYESLPNFIRKLIYDISVLDSGIINKVFNKMGELVQMRVIDGATVVKNPDMYGSLANRQDKILNSNGFIDYGSNTTAYNQAAKRFRVENNNAAAYFQFNTTSLTSMPIAFGRDEIIWLMSSPDTHRVYSTCSPVQAAVDVVLSLVFGSKYHLDFFMNSNSPEGIISIPGAQPMDLANFKQKLNETIMTSKDQFGLQRRIGFRMPVVGTEGVTFTPLTMPSKDMEIIEQQLWFTKILWMQFGVTASEMGFTEDASKNVDESQIKAARRKAVKPLLDIIQYGFNSQILPELDHDRMFMFKFDEIDINDTIKTRTLQEQEIRMGIKTPQMIMEEEGIDINRVAKDTEENMKRQAEQQQALNPNPDNKKEPKNDNGGADKKVEKKSVPTFEELFEEVAEEIKEVGEEISKGE